MFELLKKHIGSRISLSEDEFDLVSKYFVPKKLRKNQFLLNEGEVCSNLSFVNSGCLREYTIDMKGAEHIIQFAIEDWWISDLNSFLTGQPAVSNIDALRDSEVLLLERSTREEMLAEIPKMEKFFRLLLEANFVATRKRINDSLSASAEERYLKFIKTYPQLIELVPQSQIASYLGITPQSLSRIRKEMAGR